MALTSGFFNSLNNDRLYDAEQMSSIFDGVIADGVYETIGNKFRVQPGEGMQVMVGSGRAWFDHTWTLNDTSMALQLDPAETGLNRIDTVVIEVDHTENVRANSIKVVTGTPAAYPTAPAMIKNEYVKQYPLADIYVAAGQTAFTDSAITNRVGTSDCPFVIGVVEVMTIDMFVAQWTAEFREWMTANEDEFRAWYDPFVSNAESRYNNWYNEYTQISEGRFSSWYREFTEGSEISFDTWMNGEKTNFDEWFQDLKDELDENQAGHLQNEINAIIDYINNDMPLTNSEIDAIFDSIFDKYIGRDDQ